jgi:DNA-directed RNA polymerase subunit M/transcription elongation factor TFIIS
MSLIDQPGEWLHLYDHYRRMTDGELIKIAGERDQLTDLAQQILAMELSARRLKFPENSRRTQSRLAGINLDSKGAGLQRRSSAGDPSLSERNIRPTPDGASTADDPYAKDREFVEILAVWSLRDALQVQHLLDVASIPFCMGAENGTGVDPATSNFATGVSVKVMRIGVPWALQALERYEPKDVPESEKWHWKEEIDVRCPKCRSKDIVFEEIVPSPSGPPHKYKWTCHHCRHAWEDDGVAAV